MRWIVVCLLVANVAVLLGQLLFRDDLTAPVDPPAASATPPVTDTPSIQLLSELRDDQRQSLADPAPKVDLDEELSTSDTETPLCTLVGPFPKLLEGEYFVERLAALDVQASVRELEIPGEVGYWVYLPPLDTRKQAYARLRELQAKGVDSYVIPKGELENGISFGMFSQADLAEQRLEAMLEQGYQAELAEIARSYKEVWVILPPGEAGLLDPMAWQNLLAAEEALERRQNYCPPVASE